MDKDEVRRKARERWKENPEKGREKNRLRYYKNVEKSRQYYLDRFYKNKEAMNEYSREYSRSHKEQLHDATLRRRGHNLDFINNIKAERGCSACGEKDPIVLVFHHRNPEEKEYGISHLSEAPRQRIIDEIEKCDVYCSNCHLRLHWNLRHPLALQ